MSEQALAELARSPRPFRIGLPPKSGLAASLLTCHEAAC